MDSSSESKPCDSESKPYDSFKSKKMLHSSSSKKPSPSDEIPKPISDPSPWSSITPEKPANHPHRAWNRHAAFSVKEVREEAAKLQVSEQDRIHHPDRVGSMGQQIGSESGEISERRLLLSRRFIVCNTSSALTMSVFATHE